MATGMQAYECFIDGRWESHHGDWITVRNPATGQTLARVPCADAAAVDRAVAAARRAFAGWRRTNPSTRANLLHAIADRVTLAEATIARAITSEQGKPLAEAHGEVQKLAKTFHFYAEEATRVFGSTIPNEEDGFLSIVEREPIGVVGAITPWNYPVELVGWKLCAALAAGCTIVVKPSEYTPVSVIELFRCLKQAGLPAGCANLITGDGSTGQYLVAHPGVDKIAFTGSLATGQTISRSVTGIKPITLELGGNCPLIITATADLDAAVKGAARRAYRNAGQICIAVNRAYVQRHIYPAFLDRLVAAVRSLRVGDGMQEGVDIGPLTTPAGVAKVDLHVQDAVGKQARLLRGGKRPDALSKVLQEGNFYEPTLLADCTQQMLVMHEETFGPVLGVAPFDSLDEAIELANATPYGLAAYAYTNDIRETFKLTRELDFGSVGINHVDAGIINAPYGGRKQSGIGYEHGHEGMQGYLLFKHVRVRHGN